jgi:hypothetical protein
MELKMIKSLFVVTIIFLSVSTAQESYAQAADEANSVGAGHAAESANSGHSSETATDGNQSTEKVPTANLFPNRDLEAWRTMNSVAPSATTTHQETSGLQHEFHGEYITIFNVNNGVPR